MSQPFCFNPRCRFHGHDDRTDSLLVSIPMIQIGPFYERPISVNETIRRHSFVSYGGKNVYFCDDCALVARIVLNEEPTPEPKAEASAVPGFTAAAIEKRLVTMRKARDITKDMIGASPSRDSYNQHVGYVKALEWVLSFIRPAQK